MTAPVGKEEQPSGNRWLMWTVILLVVFGLAFMLIPVFTGESLPADLTRAGNQAHGIHLGLMNYASDHDGQFPTATKSSNEAFRKLIPDYIADEKPFYVRGSSWHVSSKFAEGPDNEIGPPPNYPKALEKGENHWAYVSDLDDTSKANLPLIMDGFSEEIGVYAKSRKKRGDRPWGERAIVVYVDGGVKQEPVDPKTGRVLKTIGGKQVDFVSEIEKEPGVKVLNPE